MKDNIDVAGIPTTAGSKAMANCTPTQDAFIISKLRQAGAIILAKVPSRFLTQVIVEPS